MKTAAVVLSGLLLGGSVAAGGQQAHFRGGVELVSLNVVVTDGHDKPVTGLDQDDFIVFEDGIRQDVSFFATTRVPLDLALLLDTSASMSDKMATMQEAAKGFISTLQPGDRVAIVDIKDRVKILHVLDESVQAARDAIDATYARGGTALYNGIYLTLKDLTRQRPEYGEIRRQAIAVLSDGNDTASLVSFDDVMEEAKRSGVAIYTIALRSSADARESDRMRSSSSEHAMRALARETGARAFFPSDIAQLAGVYGTISEELAMQYALGYMPKNTDRDGTYRRIVVQVANAGGVRTRTRAGYMAPEPGRFALR